MGQHGKYRGMVDAKLSHAGLYILICAQFVYGERSTFNGPREASVYISASDPMQTQFVL